MISIPLCHIIRGYVQKEQESEIVYVRHPELFITKELTNIILNLLIVMWKNYGNK